MESEKFIVIVNDINNSKYAEELKENNGYLVMSSSNPRTSSVPYIFNNLNDATNF